jgi:hypothetical protein
MELDKLLEELENWQNVRYRYNNEGVEYCFLKYSSFEEIEDEEFHVKRQKLMDSMVDMKDYIQQKITEVEDKISDVNDENYE